MTQALMSVNASPPAPELNNLHFGFRQLPFQCADLHGFFTSSSHVNAYNQLLGAIRQQQAVVAMLGVSGGGKTLLLNKVMHEAPAHLKFVFCASALLDFEHLLDFFRESLGVSPADDSPQGTIQALSVALGDIHAAGRRCLLVIDNAHALGEGVLGQLLGLLRKLRFDSGLQLILTGDVMLGERLRHEAVLHPLAANALFVRLDPLSETETTTYVRWQLKLAGVDSGDIFSTAVIRRVFRHSNGIPGWINRLCYRALLLAQQQHQPRITVSMISSVADESGFSEVQLPRLVSDDGEQSSADSPQHSSQHSSRVTPRYWPVRLLTVGVLLAMSSASAFWLERYFSAGGDVHQDTQGGELQSLGSLPVQQLSTMPAVDSTVVLVDTTKPAEQPPLAQKSTPITWDRSQMADEYLRRGDRLLELGDVAGARQFYQTAAEWGSHPAQVAVGKTFDPLVLEARGLRGVYADPEQAAQWYRLARESGEREADTRLRSLERANLLEATAAN